MVKLAWAKTGHRGDTDTTEFKVTPDQLRAAITPRTRLFVLNRQQSDRSVYTPRNQALMRHL